MKRKENKEWKEKSMMKHEEVGNIEKIVFVIFGIFLKQNKKERNSWLLTTNGSTNHANLLVIVILHVSLTITSSWFKRFQSMTHAILSHQNSTQQVQATLKPSKLNKSKNGVK